MIHKKPGDFRLHRLRIIHIFEADYNGLLGLLFNIRMIRCAHDNKLINVNQWGGMPGSECEDLLILKQLTYDVSTITKTSLTSVDMDAAAC